MEQVDKLRATAFGGCDIIMKVGDKCVAELQAIVADIAREATPIRTIGTTLPKREKRGVVGSLVATYIYDKEVWANDEHKTIEVTFHCEDGRVRVYYVTEVDLLNGPPVEPGLAITFVAKDMFKGEIQDGLKRE